MRILVASLLLVALPVLAIEVSYQSPSAAQIISAGGVVSPAAFPSDAATNRQQIVVSNHPSALFNGVYTLMSSNLVTGHAYQVYTNNAIGTNYLSQNDPGDFEAYGASWSSGGTNDDPENPTNWVLVGTEINMPTANENWADNGGNPLPLYTHYVFGNVNKGLKLIPTNSPSGTIRFVDSLNGDDGNDGQSVHSPFRTMYRATATVGTNSTIYIMPGDYGAADFVVYTNGYTFQGIGVVRATNSAVLYRGNTYRNFQFVRVNDAHGSGQSMVFDNCLIGDFTGILAYHGDEPQRPTFRNCWIRSNGSGIDSASKNDVVMTIDHCTVETVSYVTNGISFTRGLLMSGSQVTYIYDSTFVVSNSVPGLTGTSVLFTNCGILLDGTSCRLFLGGVSFKVTGSSAVPIAYVNGATSAQVTWIGNPSGLIRTNFVTGKLYTNSYGCDIEVSTKAALTSAVVSGDASLALEVLGWETNFSSVSTPLLAGTFTNILSSTIPSGSQYTFTNNSSGAGNSALPVGGQIKLLR